MAGLFGNFNGDRSNNFVFRNGTQLPSNSAERAFNALALSWQVLQNETVFRYNETNAQPWNYYYNASLSFVPIFVDEIKTNTTALVLQLFKGDQSFYGQADGLCYTSQRDDTYYKCLVDVAYSGSLATGNDSKAQSADIANSQQQVANAGPSIDDAPDSLHTRWNQLNLISFLVTSAHTFNVSVLGAAVTSEASNSTNGTVITISDDIPSILSTSTIGNVTNVTLTWTPSSLNITGFTISVTDSLGATASWAPVTYYCTCVNAASVCLYPNASDTSSTSNSTNSTSNTSAPLK